jgi:hypothetical protein
VRRHLVLLLAAVGIMVSCSACDLGNGTTPEAFVGVVGDSITYLSESSIEASLANNAYAIKAYQGDRIDQVLPEIASMAINPRNGNPAPQEWILNLGTNDASQDYSGWQASFSQMIADASYSNCVILVTINTYADTIGDSNIAATENAEIKGLHRIDPSKYLYIDWNGLVHNDPDLLQPDGIHPSAKGQQALAAWYRIALSACPGQP